MIERKTAKRTPFIARIGAVIIAVLLVRQTFGGILRMLLQQYHLNAAWFVPDALISAGVALSFYAAYQSKDTLRRTVAILSGLLILLPAVVGYFNGNNLISLVSGYKVIAPLILCMNTPFLLREMTRKYFVLWCALLAATILFLIGNQFIDYPWVGGKFSQFGQEKDIARQWYASYVKDAGVRQTVTRLAGASVASISAAAMIVLLYALIRTRLKKIWVELLVVAACAYGVFLADSKTAYFCLLLIFVTGNITRLPEAVQNFLSVDLRALTQQALCWLLLGVGLIPVIVGFSREPVPYFAYNSFLDRINFTWPSSIRRMEQIGGDGAYIWGTGFGSFGGPSSYSAKYIMATSDADNFLLYQFAICGLLAVGLYYLLARVATRAEGTAVALFAALIPYSLTSNNESPEFLLLAGLAVSNVLYATRIQWLPFRTRLQVRY